MRMSFHEPAEEHERYAQHAFDRFIGQIVPFRLHPGDHAEATIVNVVIDDDGRGAVWTVDLDDTAAQQVASRFTGWKRSGA